MLLPKKGEHELEVANRDPQDKCSQEEEQYPALKVLFSPEQEAHQLSQAALL